MRELFDLDFCKVMLAGVAGISTTLTNLDLIIKCLVGVATFIYIVAKTLALLRKDTQHGKV
jgi:hypothetical protein